MPRYLVNFLVGAGLVLIAPTLAELRLLHYVLAGVFGLVAVVGLILIIINFIVQRVQRNLQHVPAVVTLLVGAFSLYTFQRSAPIHSHPIQIYLTWTHFFWLTPAGKVLIVGSCIMGLVLTWYFKWFSEDEIDARDRGGWLGTLFNGQAAIRRAIRLIGLGFLMRSVPNPDYAIVVVLFFYFWDDLAFVMWRGYMYAYQSPDTSRYIAHHYRSREDEGAGGERKEGPNDYTVKALESLRAHYKANPSDLNKLSRETVSRSHQFSQGLHHYHVGNEEEIVGEKRTCTIM